jgi:predicted Zn-dependent peptidase
LGRLSAAAGDAGVEPGELQRAKASLLGSLGAHLQSVQSLAEDTTDLFVHELASDYHATFAARLDSITREAVEHEARASLQPRGLVVVVVGDRQQVEADLRTDGLMVESAHPRLLR